MIFALLAALAAGGWVRDRIDEDWLRQPLEVAQRASLRAHKPMSLLSPSTAQRWTDGSGPSEQRVRSLAQPGNAYLEPLFYYFMGRHGGPAVWRPPTQSRCYYFPAQHGREFDAGRVRALVRLCYVGADQRPYESGWTAIE